MFKKVQNLLCFINKEHSIQIYVSHLDMAIFFNEHKSHDNNYCSTYLYYSNKHEKCKTKLIF